MNREELKKILIKANDIQKGKEIAMAREFISIDEKINNVDTKLSDLSEGLKKKLDEELSYEVDEQQIVESVLSKVLIPKDGEKGDKGDPGRDGKDGVDGKDGLDGKDGKDGIDAVITETEIKRAAELASTLIELPDIGIAITQEPEAIRNSLGLLEGEERLDASAIKNLPKTIEKYAPNGGMGAIKELRAGTNITIDNSILGYPLVSSSSSPFALTNGSGTTVGADTTSLNIGGELTTDANIGLSSDTYIFSISQTIGGTNYFLIDSKTTGKLNAVLGDYETNFTVNKTDNRLILNTTGGINFVDLSLPGASNGYVWTLSDRTTGMGGWASVGSFVTDVTGTANRITSSGGTTPQIDISSSYVGQTSITTLGTISTGTWNATTIGVTKGGTGTSTQFTLGSVVFAGASGVYTQDNANFFWDDTNNRLGLGTASPSAKLHIVGASDIQQLLIKGHSTQTSNLIEAQKSSTTDPIFALDNTGGAYFRSRVSGTDGRVDIVTGANPEINIRGDAVNGYFPTLNYYMAGIKTGSISGYNGLLFSAEPGYTIGSWSFYQNNTPFYVKSGYIGTHTVPMFRVRGYQGDNDGYRIWQDGKTTAYGTGASVNYSLAKRTGLAAVASGTGGTLPTNTYYYKVTASNFVNETIGSAEASVAVTLGQNVVLTWDYNNLEGVDHYRVYRSTTAGSYGASTRVDTGAIPTGTGVPYYIVTMTDTGYTPTSGTPPTSVTHDIMTYRKWEGGTGKFMDFEDYDGTTLTSVNSDGSITLGSRILEKQGADVASANDLTLGLDGNSYEITGTTQINAITTASWQNGSRITLLFTSNPTVKHNTAGGGGTAVILLAGAADFSTSAGDTLSLILSEIGGTQAWREISRSVI